MNALQQLLIAVRTSGWKTVSQAIRYTLFRDLADRRFADLHIGDPAKPGGLLSAQPIDRGGRFQFEQAELEVAFLAPDLVRVSWGPAQEPMPYAIDRSVWPEVEVNLNKVDKNWVCSSSMLTVTIGLEGSLDFRLFSGADLRSDLPPQRYLYAEETAGWVQTGRLETGEHIFGLGEQSGPLNLRGSHHRIWNTDPGGSYGPGTDPLYMPMPVYLSLRNTGSSLVFYENSYPAVFGFGPSRYPSGRRWVPPYPARVQPAGLSPLESDRSLAYFAGGMLRYYFIPGPPHKALERFTELTGRAPLPPRWALGYHQSRWGYQCEDDVREVMAGFIQHQLPLSAIHLDIDYMDGYRVFTVNQECFPNLAGLANELHAQGVRLVTILDPGVKQDPEYDVFREGLQQKVFCSLPDGQPSVGQVWPGWCLFPDFTNPAARRWWGSYYPSLHRKGVNGFWHDMNEPSSFAAWGDLSLPVSTRHSLEGRAGSHSEGHNLYGLQMNRAGFEALRAQQPDQRPWIVSRSGWVSQQRYAWNWTGDTESSWEALRMTLATVIGLGLSGIPYSGPDICGFSGNPDAELFLRAFQLSTFLPFFRTHSAAGTARREPWVFGEPYTSIIRQHLQLRSQLIPYLYTLAWESSQTGAPFVRPLFWNNPSEPSLWDEDDAFLLGDALLVAPVLQAGAQSRPVHLPAGQWFDFLDGKLYPGQTKPELTCGLERIPVLVRSGQVLPLEEGDLLSLHIYPPSSHENMLAGQLYSDPGDGYEPYRLDRFFFEDHGASLVWESQGEFPFPYARVQLIFHGSIPESVEVDGRPESLVENSIRLTRPFSRLTTAFG